jgi:hypothetical protein
MTKDQLNKVGGFLERCQLAGAPHIQSHWKSVEFRNLKKDWDTETTRLFIQENGKPIIFLYPVLDTYKLEFQAMCVLRAFGEFILTKAGEDSQTEWAQKLVLPTVDQVSAFQQRLNEGFNSYREVVESLKTPVDRLVATHLANSLMSNGQAHAGACNVDIRKWGPTQEFANLRRFYSLAPLTSAYCPEKIHKNFGDAFASCVVDDLGTVLHTAVAETMKQLIERVLNSAR